MPPPAFAGYTTSLTCGVWVGLDKPATIIPKGYGAALALPVWVDVMKRASADKYPAGPLNGGGPLRMDFLGPSGCFLGAKGKFEFPGLRFDREIFAHHFGRADVA